MTVADELNELMSTARTVLKEDLSALRHMSDDRRRELYNQIKEDEETFKFEFTPEHPGAVEVADNQEFRGEFATARLFLHVASKQDDRGTTLAPNQFNRDETRAAKEYDDYRSFDIAGPEELKRRIRDKDEELYEFVVKEIITQTGQRDDILASDTNDIRKSIMAYLRDRYQERVQNAERAVSLYIQHRGLPNVITSIEEAVETTADSSDTREEVQMAIQDAMAEFSSQVTGELRRQQQVLQAELDGLEVNVATGEMDTTHLEDKIDEIQSQISQFETKRHRESQRIESLIKELDEQRETLDQKVQELEAQHEETVESTVEAMEETVGAHAQQVLEDELERVHEQRSQVTAEIERLKRKRDEIDNASERLQQDFAGLEERLDDIEKSVRPEDEDESGRGIMAQDARLFELDYTGRVEESLRESRTVRLPNGDSLEVSREYWNKTGSIETGDRRNRMQELVGQSELARYPLNRHVRARLYSSGYVSFTAKKELVIDAIVVCNLDAYATNGFNASSAGMDTLLNEVNRSLNRAERHDTPHLIALASPTGWTDRVIDYVESDISRTRFNRDVSICLVDLRTDELYYDSSDDVIERNRDIFARSVRAERVRECKQTVRAKYINEHAQEVLLRNVVEEFEFRPSTVRVAFEEFEDEGTGHLLPTQEGLALDLTQK